MSAETEAGRFPVENAVLTLPECIDIEDAEPLAAVLRAELNGCALVIDAGGVERVDAAVLQLLAAFCVAADEAGVFVEWRAASPAFSQAVRWLGMQEIIGLADAA